MGWGVFAGVLVASVTSALGVRSAEACSPLLAATHMLNPRTGATNVSTATSLMLFSGQAPAGLTLLANGQNVPLSIPAPLGFGIDGGPSLAVPRATYWRVLAATSDSMLIPSAEHVLTQTQGDGSIVELTRFTTAAGYDKVEGVAPVLRAMHLWRVRYPLADINSGNCVGAEYHGFITVDYDPGTVPNTPAASVIHTFQLVPKTGGGLQELRYTGETPFVGLAPATDQYPYPLGSWQPELDPTREYCLTVSAFGEGDIALLSMTSQSVCANVMQLSAPGAPPPPGVGVESGGCAVAGSGGTRTAAAALLLVAAVLRSRRRRR